MNAKIAEATTAVGLLEQWITKDRDFVPVLIILTSSHCGYCVKQLAAWKEWTKHDYERNNGVLPYKTMIIENDVREYIPNRLRVKGNKNLQALTSLIADVSDGVPKLIRFFNNGTDGAGNFEVHTGFMDEKELCGFVMQHKPQYCH
jgi:hypothetical protein